MSASVSRTRLTWEECLNKLCRQRAEEANERYRRCLSQRLALYYREVGREGRWGNLMVAPDDEPMPPTEIWFFWEVIPANLTDDQLAAWMRDQCRRLPIVGAERLDYLPPNLRI